MASDAFYRFLKVQTIRENWCHVSKGPASVSETGRRTVNDLLLGNAVLVVNKAVLLDRITHPDQVLGHFVNEVLRHEALAALQLLSGF